MTTIYILYIIKNKIIARSHSKTHIEYLNKTIFCFKSPLHVRPALTFDIRKTTDLKWGKLKIYDNNIYIIYYKK